MKNAKMQKGNIKKRKNEKCKKCKNVKPMKEK